MTTLPEQYVAEKFCQYAGYPKYNKRTKVWAGGCPICREGSSWGKKRRLYYKQEKNYIFCFNCGFKGGTVEFIKQVAGMDVREILNEADNYDSDNVKLVDSVDKPKHIQKTLPLPDDSINLFDDQQTAWWLTQAGESHIDKDKKTIKLALKVIRERLLNIAINKPNSLWLSLTDYVHKNRLTIPFYDRNDKIIFYQTRSLYGEPNLPKYLSKSGSEKSIFNINKVDPSIDSLYIFEGPIDSCFVKNGIAVAGITNGPSQDLNSLQLQQLEDHRLYKKVWVLDSQWLDETSRDKSKLLVDQGECVFIWPENIGKRYKDLNDLCVSINKPGIGYKFVDKHTHCGMKAKLLLSQIN